MAINLLVPHPNRSTSHAQLVAMSFATSQGTDWRNALPVLSNSDVTLRDLQPSDAPALAALLTTQQVTRFISPPPTTVEGFERFIAWANAQRAAGEYVCFAVVPRGSQTAVGLIQFRQLVGDFSTAEWGFAIGERFWGTGLFMRVAELALDFAFGPLGVQRLEARAAVTNDRGNGALRKLGASVEGVLPKSFLRQGRYLDQFLWTLREGDWRTALRVRASIQCAPRWVH